jgi:bis(5'-nucleosyl)-tetraphosphatase (symmetrical)
MATYVVGDIQACLTGLQRLLKKVEFCPDNDHLIAVGDLIGRGPQALETLEFLMSLGKSFDTVLGNHDLHFLAIYANIRSAKSSDKFDKLLASPKIEQYINWLRQKPLAMLLNKHTLVCHAGLYPHWSIKEALSYSNEVSSQLVSPNWQKFVANMYGSQPDTWENTLQGQERSRFIVNAFTRMRFIQSDNHLNFDCKTTPKEAPKQLKPWFEIPNLQMKKNQRVIFGHWAALHGKTKSEQFIGLDTGYLWGQSMTLLKLGSSLENMQKFSVEYKDF